MKKLFSILALFFAFALSYGQNLVITEINYNDPSGGTTGDSLEFVEIYNAGTVPIDITGYSFTTGITFTFPTYTIEAGDYVVIAKNSNAVQNFYGITGVFQWDAGQTLSNTGESLVLQTNAGVTVDSVRYFNTTPWPPAANGQGASLMLCDPSSDNNVGTNWVAANLSNAHQYAAINSIVVYGTPGEGCLTPAPYHPVFASLPYTQHFDATWINGDNLRDVPENCWKNIPATGSNSWRRNDDGVSASWTNATTGAYTPTGANSTTNSARFHTGGSASGLSGSLLLHLNFSAQGAKQLSFWHINTAGTDSLKVYLSLDSGLTYNQVAFMAVSSTWTKKEVSLGNGVAQYAILKFEATSNGGNTDVGLDEVEVKLIPANDAGITAIAEPQNPVAAGLNTVKVNIKNFGTADLTSATIGWSVNGVVQTPFTWSGLLASGNTENAVSIGTYNFTSGSYQLKVWTTSPNGQADGDNSNDTITTTLFVQGYATLPYAQHFDGTWLSKSATNDVPDEYWVNTPATGNNSWRRNDNGASASWTNATTGAYNPGGAASTTNSARFHTAGSTSGTQGVLDLYLDFSTPGTKELKYWYINTGGTDTMTVWISEDNGTTFEFLQLAQTATTWTQKSVMLGNSVSNNVILRFRATSNGGQSDIGLDGVEINILPDDDASITSIVAPQNPLFAGVYPVKVNIKNFGIANLTSATINWSVNGNIQAPVPWFGNLATGASEDSVIIGTYNFVSGNYLLTVWTSNPNGNLDGNTSNDTATKTLYVQGYATLPYVQHFDGTWLSKSATNDVPDEYWINTPATGNNSWRRNDNGTSASWTNATVGAYNPGGAVSTTNSARFHTAGSTSGTQGVLDLYLDFSTPGIKQLTYWHINTGGTDTMTVWISEDDGVTFRFLQLCQTSTTWTKKTVLLGNSTSANVILRFRATSNGGQSDIGLDGVEVKIATPDAAVFSAIVPQSGCGLTSSEQLKIIVKNEGILEISNIPVSYTIGGNAVQEVIQDTLQPGDTAHYIFSTTVDLSTQGEYNILFQTHYPGDVTTSNDQLQLSVSSLPVITTYPYYQNFENSFTGWTSGAITGANQWQKGTPAQIQLNSAHSGTQAWMTILNSNYGNNTNSYVVSPCFDFSTLTDPQLSVWLNIATEDDYDAMVMEVTTNDTDWVQFTGDVNFYNHNGTNGNVAPPKWSGNNGGWTNYRTALTGLAGLPKVRFRFRFDSDNNANDEGIAIDDIFISEPVAKNIAVASWVSPSTGGCQLNNSETVSVQIQNVGSDTLSNIPLHYSINGNTPISEVYVDTLLPGDAVIYTFATPADLSNSGNYLFKAYTTLPGDGDASNDTVQFEIFKPFAIDAITFTDDIENGNQYYDFYNSAYGKVMVEAGSGVSGSTALHFTGGTAQGTWPGNSSTTTTPAQAWSYTDHIASAKTCNINISNASYLLLKFNLKQTYSNGPKYSYFRVLVNDTIQLTDTAGVSNFNPTTAGSDPFATRVFDLTQYIGTDFTLTFQSSCKYDDATSSTTYGDNAYVDNIVLYDSSVVTSLYNENGKLVFGEFSCYPNPAKNELFVNTANLSSVERIAIYNLSGQIVYSKTEVSESITTIDISNLRSGLYAVMVKHSKGVAFRKIVVE